MALNEDQIQQIQTEIEELEELVISELTEDQLKGHYERSVELANAAIEGEQKGLSQSLIGLAESFDPKGDDLQELDAAYEKLPDPEPEASDTEEVNSDTVPEEVQEDTPDEPAGNKLKTNLVNLLVKLKAKSKTGRVTNKAVLKAALKENGIEFNAKDNTEVLTEKLRVWMEGSIETPEPEKKEPAGEFDLEGAISLANLLKDYVEAYAAQVRKTGKNSLRYNKFVRQLGIIIRQRLK